MRKLTQILAPLCVWLFCEGEFSFQFIGFWFVNKLDRKKQK